MFRFEGYKKDDLKPSTDWFVDDFTQPLKAANAQVEEIQAEYNGLLHSVHVPYPHWNIDAVWWQLLHAPTASEWANVLASIELLFFLPASNGEAQESVS